MRPTEPVLRNNTVKKKKKCKSDFAGGALWTDLMYSILKQDF